MEEPSLIYKDRTEEYREKKAKYLSSEKNEIEEFQLKFKKISLNVNKVFNNHEIDELSKIVINCCICGSTFGKIFQKKQKCILCQSIVCSNCNSNQIPLNVFETVNNNGASIVHGNGNSHNGTSSNNTHINTCNLCYSTLSKILKKMEIDKLKELSMNSNFIRFYEMMHLNIVDINKNLPKFKLLVESIQDSSSLVEISKAKELEPVIAIHIKELESGINQLKQLKPSSPIQGMVNQNLKLCFAEYLQSSIPNFRLYQSELNSKKSLPPKTPSQNTNNNNNNNNNNSSNNSNTTNVANNSNTTNNANNNNNSNSGTSPPSTFSSFFSSVSKVFTELKNSTTLENNKVQNEPQQEEEEEDDIYKSTVISVGPAIVPISGSLVTITGNNLNKPSIKIIIGGIDTRPLKQTNNAIMVQSPPFTQESEHQLLIKDGAIVLSEQFIFYTNSCFQTEKDLTTVNNYALDMFENSEYGQDNNNIKRPISNQNVHKDYIENPIQQQQLLNDIDDDQLIENIINIDDLEINNNNNNNFTDHWKHQQSPPFGSTPHNGTLLSSPSQSKYPSTGNSRQDIIIDSISPTKSPLTGTKITIQFKYPVSNNILVNLASIPIHYIDISNQNRVVSFLSPPLKEGRYNLELINNSKSLELLNIIYYERLNDDKNGISKMGINNTSNSNLNSIAPSSITNKNRFFKEQQVVKTSSRVWGNNK